MAKYYLTIRNRSPVQWKVKLLNLEELAVESHVHPGLVHRFMELGLIDYHGRMEQPYFNSNTIDRINRILRLRSDLGINWLGIGLVLDLVDEIDYLKDELKKQITKE